MSAGTRLNIGAHYAWRSSRSNFVYASSFNRCRCQNLANGATTQHTLDVPDDFESLIALYLVFIPNGTNPGAQFTTGITWGARAAANNTNVGVAAAFPYSAVGGDNTWVDVQSAIPSLAALAAGDTIGLDVQNNVGNTMSLLYSLLVYTFKQT
jgi:hypothetical protein